MQEDVRASLEDLAIRWETPRGRELKTLVIQDARNNRGEAIGRILKDFMYVSEVPNGKDLRCITWDGEDLAGTHFTGCDLSWASLAGCNLQRSDLRESNLKRANLSGANLAMAKLDGCDGSRTDFSQANMDGTHFKEAKLTGAVFEEAQASRASFDSASLAKANFRGAKLEQTNFFNADCNNCNFDTGAFDQVASQPSKAWGIRNDMGREEFEREVGLHAITSRTTKRFKGLDAVLKAQSLLKLAGGDKAPAAGAPPKGAGPLSQGPYFGSSPLGTRKFRPGEMEVPEEEQTAEGSPSQTPPPSARPQRPPPPGRVPGGTGRMPSGRVRRPTTRGRRPVGSPTGQFRVPPQSPPPQPAPPPAPAFPLAPLDPGAPDPSSDWAKAIGTLMQFKPQISKIVIELGDRSVILYEGAKPE